jgi:hypothetical protein
MTAPPAYSASVAASLNSVFTRAPDSLVHLLLMSAQLRFVTVGPEFCG